MLFSASMRAALCVLAAAATAISSPSGHSKSLVTAETFTPLCKTSLTQNIATPYTESGAWSFSSCDYRYFLDTDFADALLVEYKKAFDILKLEHPAIKHLNVLEIGAGCGCYTTYWEQMGAPWLRVFGVEGVSNIGDLTAGRIRQFDLTSPVKPGDVIQSAYRGRAVHVVVCLEVLEHIPKSFEDTVLQHLTKRSPRWLFLSWADSKGGNGHVNHQSREYVIKTMENLKYSFSDDISDRVCNKDYKICSWFKHTFRAFHRGVV